MEDKLLEKLDQIITLLGEIRDKSDDIYWTKSAVEEVEFAIKQSSEEIIKELKKRED